VGMVDTKFETCTMSVANENACLPVLVSL